MTDSTEARTAEQADQQSPPTIKRGIVVLDTPDLTRSSDFYAKLLGVEVSDADSDWVSLKAAADGLRLAFQLAPNLKPPTWPSDEVPQQFHLDLHVDDLDAAERYVVSIGALPVAGPGVQPDFRVYLDPVGHPFCLCVS